MGVAQPSHESNTCLANGMSLGRDHLSVNQSQICNKHAWKWLFVTQKSDSTASQEISLILLNFGFREQNCSGYQTDPVCTHPLRWPKISISVPNLDLNPLLVKLVSGQWSEDTCYHIWPQARRLQAYRSESLARDVNNATHTSTKQNKPNDPHGRVKNKQGFTKYQSRSLIYWMRKSIVFFPVSVISNLAIKRYDWTIKTRK